MYFRFRKQKIYLHFCYFSALGCYRFPKYFPVEDEELFILRSQYIGCWHRNGKVIRVTDCPGPIFCLLLGVSSGCPRPITGQVTEVTWPVIGWAQSELTPSKRQKTGPGHQWEHWSLSSTSPVKIRAVTMMAFLFQCDDLVTQEPRHQQPWFWHSFPKTPWF